MTLDEVIQFTKQAIENVNPDKRVCTEFRFTVEQVKQLLEWLEDYKRLKDEMIPAYDEAEIDAVIAEIQRCTDLSTPGFIIRSSETLRDEIAMLKDYKQLKADYIELDNRIRKANTENDELKRLLRSALESFDFISDKLIPYTESRRVCDFAMLRANPFDNCFNCPLSNAKHKYCKWIYYDEAMKLLGGTDNAEN